MKNNKILSLSVFIYATFLTSLNAQELESFVVGEDHISVPEVVEDADIDIDGELLPGVTYIIPPEEIQGASGYSEAYLQGTEESPVVQAFTAGIVCQPAQTDETIPYPSTIFSLDTYFIFYHQADWLPQRPVDPDNTIEGIDADNDCVRDDIEHYIASTFRRQEHYQLRHHLFEYAIWMGRFLEAPQITEEEAKTITRNLYGAGQCARQQMGSEYSADVELKRLFAEFHNTYDRSYRYIDNSGVLFGWVTREDVIVNCDAG